MNAKKPTYNGRVVDLVAGQRELIVENTEESIVPWTVYTNVDGTDDNSVFVEIQLLGVGYGTSTNITYTVSGVASIGNLVRGTGDYYTGVGACRIFATALTGNASISVSFVQEQKTLYVPPQSYLYVGPGAPGLINLGYPPFSRYLTAIYTSNNFNLILRDEIGVTVYNELINVTNDKEFYTRFFHPPNTYMRVQSTVGGQRFIVAHYQQ